jgi:hypothetical protein
VRDLRRELESTDDRLLEVEADASASRIESARCNDLIERRSADRVRLVEEELRRTRIEAERYRSGWMRLSGGGGSDGRGGRKRRADAAGLGSGDIGGGGGGGEVDNGSRTMADVGRSGRKRRRRRRKRRCGDSTPPLRCRQSIRGSIVGRGGDAPIGRRGGLARRRRRRHRRRSGWSDVFGEQAKIAIPYRRRRRRRRVARILLADNDDWGRVTNSTSVAAVARDEDPVRRRIATSLLNREGRATAGSRRCRTSLHQGGGIIDRDGGSSLSPSAAALSPCGFVHDASTEEGTTIARMDRNVETDVRSYVTSILCQMAEEASD